MVDDYDGPVVFVPAHKNNIRPGRNHPKVLVLHTPEEPADATEVTPFYFARNLLLANPPRRASTHYYASGGVNTGGEGDLYQMVRESEGAIANGVVNKPYPADTNGAISLNLQSLSLEIEGYAANIATSMPVGSKQWETVVRWVESRSRKYGIPLDRQHVIGHYEVAANRTDPGTLNIGLIVQHAEVLRNPLEEDDEMKPYLAWDGDRKRIYLIGPWGASWVQYPVDARKLEAKYGKAEVAYTKHLLDALDQKMPAPM